MDSSRMMPPASIDYFESMDLKSCDHSDKDSDVGTAARQLAMTTKRH